VTVQADKMLFMVAAMAAEMERELIHERRSTARPGRDRCLLLA
jgi:DNA invertase Pin-like site-specific DNA recombinase